MAIFRFLTAQLQNFGSHFSAAYYDAEYGTDRRFPSLISAAFRFVLRYILFAVPVLWAAMLVVGLVQQLPFLGALAAGLAFTALILAGIFLLFLLAMALESFAKVFSCLILYGELPGGAENPVDALVIEVVAGL